MAPPSQQPRHTESSILQSYLLPPSPLTAILPYASFLQLIPVQHRSNPHLKRLYRDLQFQRNIDIDTVRRNIEREVTHSVALKTQFARRINGELGGGSDDSEQKATAKKRKRGGKNEDEDEFTDPVNVAVDVALHNASLHPAHRDEVSKHPLTAATRKHHTAESLVMGLESARLSLEAEIEELEAESATLLAEMNEIVGGLSDLRYGRFARPVSDGTDGEGMTVENETLEALVSLQQKLKVATAQKV